MTRPFKFDGLSHGVVAKIYSAMARYNSQALWGHLRKPATPQHIVEARRRDVIRKALARVLFDMDPVLYRGFAHTVHDKCVRPCNAPHMLATALVEDLDNSGWELTASKYWVDGEVTPTKARMALYDMLFFAFDFGTGKEFAKMGDSDPVIADKARAYTVDRILETLSIDHAVLSRRPKR